MVYSVGQNMGKIGGIKLDRTTGEMITAWTMDCSTPALQAILSPCD